MVSQIILRAHLGLSALYFYISGGTTLQTGLALHNKNNYHILAPEKLDMFRRSFIDLQMVTVDEVSMCGADKLYEIHRRLCEILISEDLFANKAVMFVGDLMQVKTKHM